MPNPFDLRICLQDGTPCRMPFYSPFLPEIPSMGIFWIENMTILQENWRDGIGALRKEHALSLRCGQLRYLRLSQDQTAAGREREAQGWKHGRTPAHRI